MLPGCSPVPASKTNQLTTEQKKATAYDAVTRVPMLEQPAAWAGALSKCVSFFEAAGDAVELSLGTVRRCQTS